MMDSDLKKQAEKAVSICLAAPFLMVPQAICVMQQPAGQKVQEAMVQTPRQHDNQPDKRHGKPWCNEVAVAVVVDRVFQLQE